MSNPRLAYLVSRYPAVSHTFILREVRLLREQGFDIQVASINAPDRPDSGLTAAELEEARQTYFVKRAGARAALAAHLSTLASAPAAYIRGLLFAVKKGRASLPATAKHLAYFVEAVMLGRWMRRNGLTHLHVHFATPAATVALIATRVFAIDLSMTVHGPDEFDDVRGYHLAEKVAGSRFVWCIGAYARSQMMRVAPIAQWDRFEVAPLGVDPEIFTPGPARPPSDVFEVLCIGRLVSAKGQAVLIGAIDRLVRAGRRVRLRLAGDGPDRGPLERLVAERGLGSMVVFEGAVNADVIRGLYQRADAFALASFAEGVPVVLMEAMAMGVPVVSTAITGIPELIRPGLDGLLVPASDEAALADAIARLMDDRSLRDALGAAGRRRVIERYNLKPNVNRLADVFRRRIRGSAPADAPARPSRLVATREERA